MINTYFETHGVVIRKPREIAGEDEELLIDRGGTATGDWRELRLTWRLGEPVP